MKAIETQDICQALYAELGETMARVKGNGRSGMTLDFSDFEGILMKTRLSRDPATIRAKWRMLQADEVLKRVGRQKYGKAAIDFEVFEIYHVIPVVAPSHCEREIEIEIDRYAKEGA